MGGAAKRTPSSPHFPSPFPPQPTDPNHPAVSFLHDPEPAGVLSDSEANIVGLSSWNPALSYDPDRMSATPYSISKTSRDSAVRVPPPPPSYVAGEFEAYTGNMEHGNSETETEKQSFGPSPYPQPLFQAGELSEYESVFEHGGEERETEGFMPHYFFPSQGFWEFPAVFFSAGPMHMSSPWFDPNIYYPFLTPPGAFSHYHSNYETGGDYWDKVGYERVYGPQYEYEPMHVKN